MAKAAYGGIRIQVGWRGKAAIRAGFHHGRDPGTGSPQAAQLLSLTEPSRGRNGRLPRTTIQARSSRLAAPLRRAAARPAQRGNLFAPGREPKGYGRFTHSGRDLIRVIKD